MVSLKIKTVPTLLELCLDFVANYCASHSLGYRYNADQVDVTGDTERRRRMTVCEKDYPDPERFISCLRSVCGDIPEELRRGIMNRMPVKGPAVRCAACNVRCPVTLCRLEIVEEDLQMLLPYRSGGARSRYRKLCNGCATKKWRSSVLIDLAEE